MAQIHETAPASAGSDVAGNTRVAYLVSRFPITTETFVLRELVAVADSPSLEVELAALLPAKDPVVHAAARPWVDRMHRAAVGRGVVRAFGFLARRPTRTAGTVSALVRRHWAHPRDLARALTVFLLAADLAVTFKSLHVDRVHAHFAGNPGIAAWVISRLVGIPYSITTHAYDLYRHDQHFLEPVVTSARRVVTISRFNRAFLEHRGADPDRLTVVRCGIPLRQFEFVPRLPRAGQQVRVLCVASLSTYKGHRFLINAIARQELTDVHLDLVGDGPLHVDLERQVEMQGLTGRVIFHGRRSESEVAEMLGSADLFVLPSIVASDGRMEGLPVALMEALAAGVPTIATNISGVPELIIDRVTGLLVEPESADALADAIGRQIANPDAARAMVIAGRELVEREFDIEASGTAMVRILLDENETPGELTDAQPGERLE